jgi:mRNA interferase MazF
VRAIDRQDGGLKIGIKKVCPVVVISQDEMNQYLETVVVCPLTSKLHPQWRTRLQIKCAQKNAEIAVDRPEGNIAR